MLGRLVGGTQPLTPTLSRRGREGGGGARLRPPFRFLPTLWGWGGGVGGVGGRVLFSWGVGGAGFWALLGCMVRVTQPLPPTLSRREREGVRGCRLRPTVRFLHTL